MHLKLLASSLQAVRSGGYLPSLSTLEALLVVASADYVVHSDIVQAMNVSAQSASTYIKQLVSSKMCKRVGHRREGIALDADGVAVVARIKVAVKETIAPHLPNKKGVKA